MVRLPSPSFSYSTNIQPPKSSVASKAPSSQAAKAPAAASKAPAKVCSLLFSIHQLSLTSRPQRPPPLRLTVVRRGPRRGSRPTLPTSTRSSSRSTPTLVSRKLHDSTLLGFKADNQQQGHGYPQLLRFRYLRANRFRSIQASLIQPPINHLFPRDPNRCPTHPPRRALQARHL